MSDCTEDDSRDPYRRASSLEELVAWDDLDFIICAYVTVLGRRPDGTGEAHHLDLVRAGCSKLDVLQRLRGSPEADSHDPGISGFDRALTRAAFERRRLLGMCVRLLRRNADSDARLDRSIRALLNASKRHQRCLETIWERLNRDAAKFTSGVDAVGSLYIGEASEVLASTLEGAPITDVAGNTPELNHLRKSITREQSIYGVAS